MRIEKVTFINVEPPLNADINSELQWLGSVFGLFGDRDKESSCFRVFVTLVRCIRHEQAISSDAIAASCGLSRGTVVYHLNRLRDMGFVMSSDDGYRIAGNSVQDALDTVRTDITRMLDLMSAVAKDIDQKLQ